MASVTMTRSSVVGRVREHTSTLLRERRILASVIAGGVVVLTAAAVISAAEADSDSGRDLLSLLSAVGRDIVHLRWQFTAVVVALAGLHYLATALAARASASGISLRLREVLLVQFAAAAANRITPAGLGGSAVTARYFTRRGLDAPAAIGAVSALAVLGALADAATLGLLVLLGPWLGIGSTAPLIHALTGKVSHLGAPVRSPWLWLAVAIAAVGGFLLRRRRTARRRRDWRHFWWPIGQLARHPRSLLTLLLSSACTTLVLGFAFAASSAMVPGPHPAVGVGALLVGYMLGGAAGNAVPVPAGLGATEAALTAALVAAHVPLQHAVEEVLIFRLLTFWLPAIIGLLATRRLRRTRAI